MIGRDSRYAGCLLYRDSSGEYLGRRERIDITPRYYLRRGQVYDTLTAATPTPPWTLKPAVVRDMSYPRPSRTEPGSFLTDPRDIYVEQIQANFAGQVSLRTSLFDKSDLLANQFDYLIPKDPRPWPPHP